VRDLYHYDQIFPRLNHRAVRSSFVTLFLTHNYVRRLSVLWTTAVQRDVLIDALGVDVVVVYARTPLLK
jgi:hypothetical protein